jgi:hypothetical protein
MTYYKKKIPLEENHFKKSDANIDFHKKTAQT